MTTLLKWQIIRTETQAAKRGSGVSNPLLTASPKKLSHFKVLQWEVGDKMSSSRKRALRRTRISNWHASKMRGNAFVTRKIVRSGATSRRAEDWSSAVETSPI